MLTEFRIGIDDTDSKMGGCTTYTGTLLFQELIRRRIEPVDFPWLVRLNPNIPWKTRGNGAVAIHIRVEDEHVERIKKIALRIVEKTSDPSTPSTDPAVVFLIGPKPPLLMEFSRRALCDVISVREAKNVARIVHAEVHFLGRSRGMIGALAAVGSDLESQHTFEIIAYRTKKKRGTHRRVDEDSVREMDSRYQDRTFNNIDPETGRILICPHGPDPVLFGIRGEDPVTLVRAFECIRVMEPIERVMMFKTNNGTDAHLNCPRTVQTLRTHMSVALEGRVETGCKVLRGGHLVFSLRDETGVVDCAAYEPLGPFRKIVRQLLPGDRLRVYGGVRRGPSGQSTVNLEKLEILELVSATHLVRPSCPVCGSSCESMGADQGFRCRRCNLRFPRSSRRVVVEERDVTTGIFIPPPRVHRHLTKPASRVLRQDALSQGPIANI